MTDSPLSLFRTFAELAARSPGRVALRDAGGGREFSREALLQRAVTVSRDLRDRGVAAGDPVLVGGPAGFSWIATMLGVWACDAVAVPVDSQSTDRETAALEASLRIRVKATARVADRTVVSVSRSTAGALPAVLPAGTAVVKLTSGSTARPRGVATTAAQLMADVGHILEGMAIRPEDWNIGVVPMSHSYGLSSVLLPLVLQGSPVLLVPSAFPESLAAALSIEEPAVFPGVPYLFDLLGRSRGPSIVRRGLRLCVSAGAPLPASTASTFHEKYGLPVRSFYGTSETGGVTFDSSPDGDGAARFEGCVGTPLPGVTLSVRSDGRVAVRGPNVACGYVGHDERSDAGEFLDGEFLTTDTARIDDRGRLHLTGRVGFLVNVGGRKVDPFEVESALRGMPGIRDAAVSAQPDEKRGEHLVAYIVAEGGVTAADVASGLKPCLAPWKIPRQFVFLAALPRNARGKPDRSMLRTAAAQRDRE